MPVSIHHSRTPHERLTYDVPMMLQDETGCTFRALDRAARPGHLRAAVRGGESGSRGATSPAPGGDEPAQATRGASRRHTLPAFTGGSIRQAGRSQGGSAVPALDRIPFLPRSRCRCNHAPGPGLSGCAAWTLHLPRIRRTRPLRRLYAAVQGGAAPGRTGAGREPRPRRKVDRRRYGLLPPAPCGAGRGPSHASEKSHGCACHGA